MPEQNFWILANKFLDICMYAAGLCILTDCFSSQGKSLPDNFTLPWGTRRGLSTFQGRAPPVLGLVVLLASRLF